MLAGDSYTRSWDTYQFKSKSFTDLGRDIVPTIYSQKYVDSPGCIKSAQLFFEMSGWMDHPQKVELLNKWICFLMMKEN